MSNSSASVIPETSENLTLLLSFNKVGGRHFQQRVLGVVSASGYHREHLSIKSSYKGYECWLSPDQNSGFAVSPELELVNVFSVVRDRGNQLLRFAVGRYPNLHLNCFEGEKLERLYKDHGFREFRRTPNWTPGQPDIVFMRRGVVNIPE